MDTLDFIQQLPKTETHLHVEGALPFKLLQEAEPARFSETPEFCHHDFRFAGLEEDFLPAFYRYAEAYFTSVERYHAAAKVLFETRVAENVKYMEVSFHLPVVESLGCDGPELIDAIQSAAPPELSVRVFAGFSPKIDWPVLQPLIESSLKWDTLDGIDSHGVGTTGRYAWQPGFWQKARDAGKETKVHVGEIGPPEDVVYGAFELGSKRIQHGVAAGFDAELMTKLKEADVTLDTCPISNYKLRVFETQKDHTFRTLFDAGVRCTVNTDDPFYFHNTLTDDYQFLVEYHDFSHKELAKVARHGFEVAVMDEATRQSYINDLDNIINQ